MDAIASADAALFRWLNTPRGAAADAAMLALSWAGEFAIVWWALALAVAMKQPRRPLLWLMGRAGAAVLLTVALTNGWKFVWFRQRPFEYLEGVRRLGLMWGNSSFPSGHAVSSFAVATVLSGEERRWRVGFYTLAALISLSRPYCGMHHPFDVLSGAGMGWAVGWLVVRGGGRLQQRIVEWRTRGRDHAEKV